MKSRSLTLSSLFLALSLTAASAATLAYWRFEEGTPGTSATGTGSILDSAGPNPGTPTGDPVYTSDVPVVTVPQNGLANGVSLNFNGTVSTVQVPTVDPILDSAGAFTVEFWMRSSDTRIGQRLLVDKSHGFIDNTGWFFQTASSPVGFVQFGLGNNVTFPTVTSSASLFDDRWHHLAGTYDGSQIELFVDGVSQGTTAAGSYASNPRAIRFGSASNNSRHYAGRLDEVRISDTVLTPDQFLNVIPEPSSLVLLLAGALGLLRRSRR